jgi:predicted transposase/invertase (TIGR01784 family)
MHYDLTLKQIFHTIPQRLLKILTGRSGLEIMNAEYPTVKKRQPDLVLRLDDDTLFHLEIQSDNDDGMAWRMLEYYQLIYRHYQLPLSQMVLYVGNSNCKMPDKISHATLSYSFQVLDIRTIDSKTLLNSPTMEENLVALLAKITNEHEVLQIVLDKISHVDVNLGDDYFEQLNILAGLRPRVKRELDIMPIRVKVEDTPFYERAKIEGVRVGKIEGKIEGKMEGEFVMLLRMLQMRFGELPQKIMERLQAADCEHLERWALLLLSAASLDEIFED